MYAHIKFAIPFSNNIGDMHQKRWEWTNYSRNEVRCQVKVKVIQNGTRHSAIPRFIDTPKSGFLPQIIYEICTRHDANGLIILETRSEVRSKSKLFKWYETLHNSKMHPHTKFGILISNNLGNMLRTQLFKKRGHRSRSILLLPKISM